MPPFTLLIKPAGPDCNLTCRYCFYAATSDRFASGAHRMSDETLEILVRDYMAAGFASVNFAWQGGEPTLMGLDFYKRVVALQKQYGHDGQIVSNALQTNGVLLDDAWCDFLNEYKFLLGISLDGPKFLHDAYRTDAAGNGSFDRVMASIERCRAHGVAFNILAMVNDQTAEHAHAVMDFFVDLGIDYLQFIPCIERDEATDTIQPFSVSPKAYGDFLCRIFDRWRVMEKPMSIRLFDSCLGYILHGRHSNCTFGPRCNDYVVVEHNGDVFCCDFFVTDDWRIGSIHERNIVDLFNDPLKAAFSRTKRDLAGTCRICSHLPYCYGGCLKDRLGAGGGRYDVPSYFCAAYKQFFDHAMGELRGIAADLAAGAAAPTPSAQPVAKAKPTQRKKRKGKGRR